ncbi:hypothetical protein WA026_019450 [Henosepilachna vigintioctopunctata]|uniref:Uncharacterized protein n=1 Tax=Henosepilachna vigintioctopunctata TaxID=420089 RepID=A0AAW1UA39_9CUCU
MDFTNYIQQDFWEIAPLYKDIRMPTFMFLNYDIILRWGFSVPQLVFYVCKKKAAEGDRVGYACTPPSINQLFIVIRVGAASLTPATDLSNRQAKSVVGYSSERVVFL